jgi:hypothetical protein
MHLLALAATGRTLRTMEPDCYMPFNIEAHLNCMRRRARDQSRQTEVMAPAKGEGLAGVLCHVLTH